MVLTGLVARCMVPILTSSMLLCILVAVSLCRRVRRKVLVLLRAGLIMTSVHES